MLRVEEIACTEVEALAPEWESLWDRAPAATPFQHPAWLLPWWRHLWGGGEAWWITLRDGARLAGLAPLFVWGVTRRCVSLAGSGVTDYLDFLIEPEHAAAGAALVMEHLARHRRRWDVCDFQELRAESPVAGATADGLRLRCEPCSTCPVLRLPVCWEELQAALPHKFRTDLRRARNRIRNAGDAAFETAGEAELEEAAAALFRLHRARWQVREEEGVMATPALQAFYAEAARELLRAGMLRLHVLRLDGAIVAALYGFAGHGRFYAYLDGFDPALARLSPGTVLMSYAVESAIREGLDAAGFVDAEVTFTHEAAPGIHGAIIRASKPAG
jgi:CelD/BcsL family acetyltransferase involved in cellulose biosynthesis